MGNDQKVEDLSERAPINYPGIEVGKVVGKGSNNVVFSAKYSPFGQERKSFDGVVRIDRGYLGDLSPEIIAQREMRGTNGKKGLGAQLENLPGLVTSLPLVDRDGREFYLMPNCRQTIETAITSPDGKTGSVKNGYLSIPQMIGWAKGVAEGLHSLHVVKEEVHGDLNTENLMEDKNGKTLIVDPDTTERISLLESGKLTRDNIGLAGIRAPELFRKGQIPTTYSDAFSFGAFIGRLFTGKYPYQGRLESSKNSEKDIGEMGFGEARGIIEDYLKDVPKPFRGFMWDCLAYHPDTRFKDGKALEKGLNKAIRKYYRSKPKARAIQAVAATALIGLLTFGGLEVGEHFREKSGLEETVEDQKLGLDIAEKMRTIQAVQSGMTRNSWKEDASLYEGLKERLGNEGIAMAYFLDGAAAYEAIQKFKESEKFDPKKKITFENIGDTFLELNEKAYYSIKDVLGDPWDWRMKRDIQRNGREKIKEHLRKAKADYEAKIAKQEVVKKAEIEKRKKKNNFPAEFGGDIGR